MHEPGKDVRRLNGFLPSVYMLTDALPLTQAKRELVDRIISKLALQGCRDRLIGGPQRRGISGGEVCTEFARV